MSDEDHSHQWEIYRTVDYCHYQQLCEQCAVEGCAVVRQRLVRRDFSDGAQRAFAAEGCATCRQILNGLPSTETWSPTL